MGPDTGRGIAVKSTKLILAAFLSSLAMFAVSFVWHVGLWKWYANNLFPGNDFLGVNTPLIYLAFLVLGTLMAWSYPLFYSGGGNSKEGARFGLLIGLLVMVPLGIMVYAAQEVTLHCMVIDVIFHSCFEEVVGGLVVAHVYGKEAGTIRRRREARAREQGSPAWGDADGIPLPSGSPHE